MADCSGLFLRIRKPRSVERIYGCMTIHAERFTGRVAEYEKYRLRYPAMVLDVLRERCGLKAEDVVADIGAGTGMLAELFLENGNCVTAVEPNAEMREVCERLVERFPKLTVVNAAAEATTLGDASVNFISVGRAWHWFDRERAVVEFRRILRPRGWVVMAANRRSRDGSERAVAYEEILKKFGRDYGTLQERTRETDEIVPLFGEANVVREELRGEQELSLEEFLGQTQSYSVAPLPGDEKYDGMQSALREFFKRYAEDGVLKMGTMCSVLACQVA